MERQRWTQDRRRKQPSLYDEYLNEGRSSQNASRTDQSSRGAGYTVRAVTPEDAQADQNFIQPPTTQSFEREFLALSSSPSSSPRAATRERASPKIPGRSSLGRRESTDTTRREQPSSPLLGTTRRRTMTFQGSASDSRGTLSQLQKTRPRVGSAQHADQPSGLDYNDRSSPNGHYGLPSSASQPVMGSSSQQVLRPKSSASNSVSSNNGPLPTPNARRILHLMKTLSGRMSGHLYYRRSTTSPWMGVYCFIRDEEGSLMTETEVGQGSHKTLVPDLRGLQVRCKMDDETGIPYIELSVPRSSLEIHLRLQTQSDLDSWFAALLCWSPMQPKGIQNRLAKPQAAQLSARPANTESRQNSEASLLREAPIIKVGQMVYWDTDVSYESPNGPKANQRPAASRSASYSQDTRQYGVRWWRRVSCHLRENGELKFFTEAENQLLTTLHLSQLSRSAIQRLDSSVLDHDNCIAIYPQYTSGASPSGLPLRPIFLSVETSVLFEVWFVLLRAFTIPQLYGPRPPLQTVNNDSGEDDHFKKLVVGAHADMFRMERGLSLNILEAKLTIYEKLKNSPDPSLYASRHTNSPKRTPHGYYVEIHLDGETRGKTGVKQSESNPFWTQEFDYLDLPAVLSSASVYVKQQASDQSSGSRGQDQRLVHEAYGLVQEPKSSPASSGYTGITQDVTIGKVEIILEELDSQKKSEQWWPIVNGMEQEVGTLLIRARAEETVILMRQEYEALHKILHNFDNGLTVAIFNVISSELKRLSDNLVNVYQVSGRSTDWLMALVEEEIDGSGKETPLSRARYNARLGSAEQDNSTGPRANDREMVVRDLNKNAALEANLLFRGNTLLTKALDTHMRRIGSEYLHAALGGVIQAINARNPECEVDPNKTTSGTSSDMSKNWQRLIHTTHEVWHSIRHSAQRCPVDLRFIFRHIKACAEDRFGDHLRTVSYSSVSGFLFLRFFCPAVLSPKLFGLLKEEPKPRAKRTFVLVAKSLQTMANMAHFGSKEPWMEPMNSFLTANRESFKKFIEDVCYVPRPPAALSDTPTAYSTPNAIKGRLPGTSKEGFPSLPYLLDEGREYANLVDLWLHASARSNIDPAAEPPTSTIHQFDAICKKIRARTQDCLSRAERAERPNSELSFRWEEVVDSLSSTSNYDSIVPRLDTDLPSPTLRADFGRYSHDSTTPIAQTHRTGQLPNGSPDPTSPISPHRRAQHDWENAPDGGAAAAAVSFLSQDRNPRSGFVLPSNASIRSGAFRSPPLGPSPFASPSAEDMRGPNSKAWGVPPPPPVPTSAGSESGPSRPASALSGRQSVRSAGARSEVEELPSAGGGTDETALPMWSKEREKERERQRREKDRERRRRGSGEGGG